MPIMDVLVSEHAKCLPLFVLACHSLIINLVGDNRKFEVFCKVF